MFEISGDDIAVLSDSDLRSLVARLALAELKAKGLPLSSVTAGGDQDATDGGIDVRVECPTEIDKPDFVPRRITGFQVKKSDMPASKIVGEMQPKGVLRDSIREIAKVSGAYVIVSAKASVDDERLQVRRKAMRTALSGISFAHQLHTDFYDRRRIANWANEYPGIIAWLHSRVGRPLAGWSAIGEWDGCSESTGPYLSDDKACLVDEGSRDPKHLTIAEGIARLREGLRNPKQCFRLVGLSGVGKTRFVQALFERGVGEEALDSSIAVYTDYSEATVPTARDMARELTARGQRAILIVDNCNPATHAELARICSGDSSQVSLISVEYDVRDDEPERTEVFRLEKAAPDIVSEWLSQKFPEVSQSDRRKIAEFSDGNFRIARAIADTIEKGETIGSLKSRDLFERIFIQRNDPAPQLLKDAEDLSLLYSIDGEDMSEGGELATIANIRGIATLQLYEALVQLQKRGVAQARGQYRAILPQAIANPLAAHALERIPPPHLDRFCGRLTARMLKSLSRRIGFLHDCNAAQAVVARWLPADGPLGDLLAKGAEGFGILENIAPVAPAAVLAKLEQELGNHFARQDACLSLGPSSFNRQDWFGLIKSIAYDPTLFDRAVLLLARLLAAEQKDNADDTAFNPITSLFHICLSGTEAPPEQRRQIIRKLAASGDEGMMRCAVVAVRALVKTDSITVIGNNDFGARPRDWGWQPKINKDTWDWYKDAVALLLELTPQEVAREILAKEWSGLWRCLGSRDALISTARLFTQTRPWVAGWIASRKCLRYDGHEMPTDIRAELERLAALLKPTDLLNRARAVVIEPMYDIGGWDYVNGENDDDAESNNWEKANLLAQEIGQELANDSQSLRVFLTDLFGQSEVVRSFDFGRGLAKGADELSAIWGELVSAYETADPKTRNATSLGGFIAEANLRDPNFTSRTLNSAIDNAHLLPHLPYLQARAGIDANGIARLRKAIRSTEIKAWSFQYIANGTISDSPVVELAELLREIATLDGGVEMGIQILAMRWHRYRENGIEPGKLLVSLGRELISRAAFGENNTLHHYSGHTVISACLVGEDGQNAARKVCSNIRAALDSCIIHPIGMMNVLEAVIQIQPEIALDTFFLLTPMRDFGRESARGSAIGRFTPEMLEKWAERDPVVRYPLLGKCLTMFGKTNGEDENEICPLFLSMLHKAPDKHGFLGPLWDRVHPRGWSGSLATILNRRKSQLLKLAESEGEQVRAWINNNLPDLDAWTANETKRDRAVEESFE